MTTKWRLAQDMKSKSEGSAGITRRTFGGTLAGALIGATVLDSAAWSQDAGPIKIGVVLDKQNNNAVISAAIFKGSQLALEQANNKILGRPVELIWLDEPNPQVGQQNMTKLITEDKVALVMGGALSSTALGMAAIAKRTKTPLVLQNPAAAELTGKDCNRYTFRLPPTVESQVRAIAPYMAEIGKKWYSITPAYAFGQDALRCARLAEKKYGATILGADETPGDTTDFSSYILKVRAAKPDVLFTALVGNDLVNFLKQWNELGMRDRTVIAGVAVSDTSFWDAGAANTVGIYAKPWHFTDPGNSPDDKKFAAAYQAKHGAPPSEKAWMGYYSMKSVIESLTAAKSTESAAIVKALENWSADDNGIKVQYRSWDHQMLHPIVIVRAKKSISGAHDFFDILARVPQKADQFETLYGTQSEIGCTLGEL